jgi:hypothetical protein
MLCVICFVCCLCCGLCCLQVRCGNYPVVERNHTVLLNWNHQTLPVLKQVRMQRLHTAAHAHAVTT